LVVLSTKFGNDWVAPDVTATESWLDLAAANEITCAFDSLPTWAAA
jgi:hypothetical protein